MKTSDVVNEIFDSILKETVDEVNIPLSTLSEPIFIGITRNTTSSGRPSSYFFIEWVLFQAFKKCKMSSTVWQQVLFWSAHPAFWHFNANRLNHNTLRADGRLWQNGLDENMFVSGVHSHRTKSERDTKVEIIWKPRNPQKSPWYRQMMCYVCKIRRQLFGRCSRHPVKVVWHCTNYSPGTVTLYQLFTRDWTRVFWQTRDWCGP